MHSPRRVAVFALLLIYAASAIAQDAKGVADPSVPAPSVAEAILPSATVTEPLKPSEPANPTAQNAAAADDALEPVNPATLEQINAALVEAGVNMSTTVDAALSRHRNKPRKTRNPVDRAFRANALGFGFSGSGFMVIYHWGVHTVLQAAGLYTPTTRFAGSSGGAIAAAMGCSAATNLQFGLVAGGAVLGCNGEIFPPTVIPDNCRNVLDRVASVGLQLGLPSDADTQCQNRLWVSTTQARPNGVPGVRSTDRERKVSTFANRRTLVEAILASSYVPGFSGPTSVKRVAPGSPFAPGVNFAYDGVGTNALPVPPTGTIVNVAVSALVPPTPGGRVDFTQLLASANLGNPSPADRVPPFDAFVPLNPIPATVGVHQRTDIYPGVSGAALPPLSAPWNTFVTNAPSRGEIFPIYGQGRADAIWWIRQNFADNAAVLNALANGLEATRLTEAVVAAISTAVANAPTP